jgi:predicted nuclease of predicted toxin-antitoxin system
VKLLIDMNLAPRWVAPLAIAGHDALHWSSVGSVNASDLHIMEFARKNDRVVLTHDLDFGNILAITGGAGPSVIQVRADDVRVEAILPQVLQALASCAEALAAGALLTIDVSRARVRMLPLSPSR